MTYEIVCICGQVSRGRRQARPQRLVCAGCGRPLLVFPRSPFAAPLVPGRPAWRGPALAGLLGLLVLAGVFAAALPYLMRPVSPLPTAEPLAHLTAGRLALEQGKVHAARRELTRARQAAERLPPPRQRELARLLGQADLLVHLSQVPLEEIVRQGQLTRDADEWEAHFAARHRGQAVLFDDHVRLDAQGRPALASHVIESGDETARVALEELTVLRALPLADGPRLLFGARLLRCSREAGGGWVIRFHPDSGVLLTEPAVVEASLPGAATPDLPALLRRQQRWLDEADLIHSRP